MSDERAVSEVLGYVLIFSLVLGTVLFITVAGTASLDDARTFEQSKNAERAFDVFHDNMKNIYFEGAPSRATEIDLADASLGLQDNVTMTIELDDGEGSVDSYEYEFAPLMMQMGDTQLVYEGGAVFRTDGDGGLILNEPPFTVREDAFHANIAKAHWEGTQQVTGGTVLVRALVDDRSLEVYDTAGTYDEVTVVIDSPRAQLWETYFDEQTPMDCSAGATGECTLDGNPETVYVLEHLIEIRFS